VRNHSDQIRECFQQAMECAQQADTQTDPKVKQQFLVLTRLWLILADRFELKSQKLLDKLQAPAVRREAEEHWR
jgi:hypothetical protein